MTVRELINNLLDYDMDEEMQIVNSQEREFEIIEFGQYSDLPYMVVERKVSYTSQDVVKRPFYFSLAF